MSSETSQSKRTGGAKDDVDPILAGLDALGEAVDTLQRANALLTDACAKALNGLEQMTTEQFRTGGDREIRDMLTAALAKAGAR